MKKRFLLFMGIVFYGHVIWAQEHQVGHNNVPVDESSAIWKKLRSLKYEEINAVYTPKFNDEIKSLEGKIIEIKGFIIPLQETNSTTYFMLSYYPYSNCYFCGQAGPETVVEVKAKIPFTYTSKPVVVSGRLKLNRTDEEHLFYILEDTSPVN